MNEFVIVEMFFSTKFKLSPLDQCLIRISLIKTFDSGIFLDKLLFTACWQNIFFANFKP